MNILLKILPIVLIIATVCICTVKPDMHKSVLVYDSAYTIVPEKQTEVESETIPIMEKTVAPVETIIKVENPQKTKIKQTKVENQKVVTEKKQTREPQTQIQKKTTKVPAKTVTTQSNTTTQKTIAEQQTKKVEQPKKVETVKNTKKVLTQTEEEIAWNVWRSNLQNKIMQDVKLPILPNGIVFKSSFSVDKFGKIYNVQTWSTTPAYTPYAIQYIAPVIRNYQGKSILVFPQGTARTITEVTGGWRISDNEKYSTPQDFNDIEKIRK